MSVVITSVEKINALKTGIEATTGESYNDLTTAVQALKNGYRQGGSSDEVLKAIVEGNAIEIALPDSVSKIGDYSFYHNNNLVNIQAAGLISIGNSAFYSCPSLALTELPAGLTSIGEKAFSGCSKLALTKLPAGITRIYSDSFRGCKALALTELPEELVFINDYAFANCINLKTITFKGKPNMIKGNSFSNCTNLIEINVPWAEGEVANAPWGATNATINYNYTEG